MPTATYKEKLVRRETIVSCIKDTVMANESFISKSEFRISSNPTERHANQCTEYSVCVCVCVCKEGTDLIAYPPQLAPVATARSGSI